MDTGLEAFACYPFSAARSHRYLVSPGIAKTTSKVGPACPMHTNLELGRTQVRSNVSFCYVYLWAWRPAIDRSFHGKFALASLYYTCPDMVSGRLSQLLASDSINRSSLYGHWTYNMFRFLRAVRGHLWRSPVRRRRGTRSCGQPLLAALSSTQRIFPEVGSYCAVVRAWSCWRFAEITESRRGH
jgi:hypothetical protein